jgi:hypothetical protein
VGPKAGLDKCGKSRPTEIRSPDRPARSQSIHIIHSPFLFVAAIMIPAPPGAKRKPSYATAPESNITSLKKIVKGVNTDGF